MKKFLLLLALGSSLIAIMNGCATVPKPEYPLPPPPDRARLKWLYDIKTEADLYPVRRLPFSLQVRRFLLGEQTPEAFLVQPYAVCAREGRVYVSDTSLKSVVLFDFTERKIKYIGKGAFLFPAGLVLDSEGRLYVMDSGDSVIKVYGRDGNFLYQFGGRGSDPGKIGTATAIAIRKDKQLIYIADRLPKPRIKVFDLQGNFLFQFGEEIPTVKGALTWPQYMAIDQEGRVYVTDNLLGYVVVFDSSGKYLRTIGEPGDLPGYFSRPKGVAVDSDNNIYVSDSDFGVVQVFNPEGNILFFWAGVPPFKFSFPAGLYVDEKDRLYVVDTLNKRVQVYQYLK